MENVADHAGDPVSVFGESIANGSKEDDCAVASMVAIFGKAVDLNAYVDSRNPIQPIVDFLSLFIDML